MAKTSKKIDEQAEEEQAYQEVLEETRLKLKEAREVAVEVFGDPSPSWQMVLGCKARVVDWEDEEEAARAMRQLTDSVAMAREQNAGIDLAEATFQLFDDMSGRSVQAQLDVLFDAVAKIADELGVDLEDDE